MMETIKAADITQVSDNEEEFYGLESLQHAFGLRTRNNRSFIIIPEVAHHLVSISFSQMHTINLKLLYQEDFISAVIQLAGL